MCDKICDCDKAYANGREDMRRDIINQLAELRKDTLGVMSALLTEMIDTVAGVK